MERLFYKPSKFNKTGDKFETDSGMGGSFTVEFAGKTADNKYLFIRKAKQDWPKAEYTFTEDQLSTEVYTTIPGKFDRLMHSKATQVKYDNMLADPCICKIERF